MEVGHTLRSGPGVCQQGPIFNVSDGVVTRVASKASAILALLTGVLLPK